MGKLAQRVLQQHTDVEGDEELTEDEELEEFDIELIEFIGDQLDEITDEELDEELDEAIDLLEKKIKRSKKPWEAKGMSKSEYKKMLKQKAKDWKKIRRAKNVLRN